MFRTKLRNTIYISIITIGMLLSSGCSSQNSQESPKQIEEMLDLNALSGDNSAVADVYQTAKVTIGDISETDAAMGSVYFPIIYDLAHEYEHGTVIFKSFQIKGLASTFVTKGEVIATLELIIEPIAKEEARIKYEKALQSYENSLEKKNKELENLQEDIADETNIYQKQILELDYEVLLESYTEYVSEQNEYLAELKAAVDLYSQESSEIIITAPCDGILKTNTFSVGDVVAAGKSLGTVSSTEKVVVEVGSRYAGTFKFGSDVEIMISSVTPAITLQGKVISAPNILYNADNASATIAITSAFPELTTINDRARSRLSIVAKTDYVNDGIIIPSNALNEVRGSTGTVYVLENGSLIKKNVKFGYRGSNYAWILEGLEPGQEVTTK